MASSAVLTTRTYRYEGTTIELECGVPCMNRPLTLELPNCYNSGFPSSRGEAHATWLA